MAQPSVASFFNTRKRAQVESSTNLKTRRLTQDDCAIVDSLKSNTKSLPSHDEIVDSKCNEIRTRSGRTVKRTVFPPPVAERKDVAPRNRTMKLETNEKQPKMEAFMMKGIKTPSSKSLTVTDNNTLPNMDLKKLNEQTPSTIGTSQITLIPSDTAHTLERGLQTPTKQIIKDSGPTPLKVGTTHDDLKNLVRKELNFDEVKSKITRSGKLEQLKASLVRIQELEKIRKATEERNHRLREGIPVSPAKKTPIVQLKEFQTIELEVLTSPVKILKTPTKLPPPTPDKNEFMSPRHTDVSKRVLFSPAKVGSPAKIIVPPAYQRFMALAEKSKAGELTLPFKYRHLIELFKGVDSVCAMFHNRRECITFKKLRPAVQRMLRKNFTESHLAQIKQIFPDAFVFTLMKMRNYGSTSKADYFQLVITPNVDSGSEKVHKTAIIQSKKVETVDEENVLTAAQTQSMNPQVMTERLRYVHHVLLNRTLNEHDTFLKSLEPPLNIPKSKVTRWHPDFDLESCSDIECAHLPQPPNVDKYTSARDILSTARNLFNSSTPMERVMARYEAKLQAEDQNKELKEKILPPQDGEKADQSARSQTTKSVVTIATSTGINDNAGIVSPNNAKELSATLLKGLPKSLVDKIRAKQAAKAFDAMTRRPSQDQEATKYSRLPELARHLRNVFISERKGVLTLDIIIRKIQNSYRMCLTPHEIEAHLRLIAKEVPTWATFHEVRKTMYLKIAKDMELNKIVQCLETVANEKSK